MSTLADRRRKRLLNQIKNDVAQDFLKRIDRQMKILDKVVTGDALDAWEHVKNSDVIGNTDQAMWNIEYGREPGTHVPIAPLIKWVKKRYGYDDGRARQMAFAVERKIYNEGIPMTRAIKKVLVQMELDNP